MLPTAFPRDDDDGPRLHPQLQSKLIQASYLTYLCGVEHDENRTPYVLAIKQGGSFAGLGVVGLITLLGLGAAQIFETVADTQKYTFRDNPANADKFCAIGLWRHCRYPNYFGEIATWWLMYALAAPALLPRYLLVPLASPIFVNCLLVFL